MPASGLADSTMHQLLSKVVLKQPMREIGARCLAERAQVTYVSFLLEQDPC